MALPRAQILSDIQTQIFTITGTGFSYPVRTVQIGADIIPQKWNTADYPLVTIEPQRDEEIESTFGEQSIRKFFHKWPIHITGVIQPEAEDVRAEGEKFLNDIVKALSTLKFNAVNTRPVLSGFFGPDSFPRIEFKEAWVGVDLDIYYHFTPGGL